MNKLKVTRIIISIAFLILFILIFFGLPFYFIAHIQFIPAFINVFLNHTLIFPLIFLLILTFFFGRVYCSTLCPFGTLQDIFIFLKYKFLKRKSFEKQKNYKVFRYIFISILFIAFFLGNITFLSIFEPYSNFGRIANEIIKPVAYFFNNLMSDILQNFDVYFIKKVETHSFYAHSFFYAFAVLISVGILAFFKGRFFCNTLCPAGAILGLISKYSIFKINISEKKCNSCGLCVGVCKAGCIEPLSKKIDYELCINCFNCIDACAKDGLKYFYGAKDEKTDETKRDFLNKTITGFFIFLLTTSPAKLFANSILIKKKNPIILPPGAQNINNFNRKCISCHLCVSACPTKVLTPTTYEYGLKNFLQPKMNYLQSYCLYDCNKCSQVCPTGAIKFISVEEKKKIQIGVAKFEMKNCVVYENETDCGMCNEYCPTKAVILKPYKNGLGIPYIREHICIGCGACEFVCPAKPNKAIYVEGNLEHKIASLPSYGKQKRKKGEHEEFPF
ncbi:MAG: 4Fe-4S dicluster domain-containing protein [Candidatus Goldbacteria bacterium]|nr:4Fe-4S dicluster domain-containing protein [Candidatus Goldiibacteriota bacterium]